jgi:hypothetical protein
VKNLKHRSLACWLRTMGCSFSYVEEPSTKVRSDILSTGLFSFENSSSLFCFFSSPTTFKVTVYKFHSRHIKYDLHESTTKTSGIFFDSTTKGCTKVPVPGYETFFYFENTKEVDQLISFLQPFLTKTINVSCILYKDFTYSNGHVDFPRPSCFSFSGESSTVTIRPVLVTFGDNVLLKFRTLTKS